MGFACAVDTCVYIMEVSNSQPRTPSESKRVSKYKDSTPSTFSQDQKCLHPLRISRASSTCLQPVRSKSIRRCRQRNSLRKANGTSSPGLSDLRSYHQPRVHFRDPLLHHHHHSSEASCLFLILQFLRKHQISILNLRVGLVFGRVPPECLLLSTVILVMGVRDLIKGIAALAHRKSERIEGDL